MRHFRVSPAFDHSAVSSLFSHGSISAEIEPGLVEDHDGRVENARDVLTRRYERIVNDLPSAFREVALRQWEEDKAELDAFDSERLAEAAAVQKKRGVKPRA